MSTAAVVVAEATKTEVDAAPISEVRPRRRARRSTKILVDSRRRRPPTDVPFLPPSPITGRQGARKSRGHHASHPRSGAHASRGDCLRSRRPRAGPHGFRQDARVPPSARARARGGGCIRALRRDAARARSPLRHRLPPHPRARCASVRPRRSARLRRRFPMRAVRRWRSRGAPDGRHRIRPGSRRRRHAGSRQRVFRPRRDSNRRAHRPGPRRSRPIARRRLRTGRGGGDATPRGTVSHHVPLRDDASATGEISAAKTSAQSRRGILTRTRRWQRRRRRGTPRADVSS